MAHTRRNRHGVSPEERELFELMLREEGIEAGGPTVPRRPEGAELVLSFAQERLWFLEQMEPGAPTYHMPAALSLKGRLDVPALKRSLDEILARHEVLRTSFTTAGGRVMQKIAPWAETPFLRIDLGRLAAGARKSETGRLAAEHAARPFDLARGPLARAALVGLGEGEHVLLWAVHHIASDGWSTAVLVRELERLYAAFSHGRPSPLAELPVQYADFVLWQRGHLTGEVLAEHLDYWRERLDGLEGGTELPLDAPRPAVRRFRGGAAARELPEALSDRLRAWSGERGLTLFMTLLAAFKVLIGRLSGDADVAVGTPIAGRELPETEELIGIFLNNLVLRTSLEGDPSFEELAERVREVTVGAYAHQDLPFEKLLTELKPERDPSRTPLFQVYFNMLNLPALEMRLEGLVMEVLDPGEAASKFDFTLYVDDAGPRIAVRAVYNALLFSSRRVDEMLRQYELVLEQAARSPRRRLSEIDLVTDEARAVLPDPAEELDGTWRGAVHELVAAAAKPDPRKVAVADRDGSWTYGELVSRAHRLAHRLIAGGVERGDPVAIYAHRSATLAWAVLGASAAGGAFVLIDPAYPARHVIEILRRARPKAFLALEAAGPLPEILTAYLDEQAGLARLALPSWRDAESGSFLAEQPASPPAVAVGPDDVAAISFTSGSTGVPKGILGRHGPLTHFLSWQSERFGLSADDRYSLLSGLAHDPLQRDLFTSLCLGATLVVPDPERLLAAGYLASWMAEEEITVAHLTPAMAQVVTEVPESARPEPPAALRWVFLTGDALTWRDVERLRRLAPGARAVNFYGSTETQRAVGFYEAVPGRGRAAGQVLPLGRGMRDVQLLVTGDAGRLAGVGELGEVRVRSPHLARGYLDEEATAERFRPNPFREADAADRVYLTGDLGRYLPDGNVAFAGRRDTQVKVRGYRIELPEIEAALERHPAVGEAVVEARPSPSGTELVAWVVPAGGAGADLDALQGHLRERLPQYMVPAAFGVLDALPITPNGKVDRRALARRPLPSAERAGEARLPAEGDLEETLVRIWREVLGVEEIGVRDNFFDLGGHSLLLVRLHSRLMEELGADLSLTELFNYPNVRSQAELLARRRAKPAAEERGAPARTPAPRTPGNGAVAVVAMAGRFPEAAGVDELWSNLRAGVEAISFFSDDELEGAMDPELLAHPKFVKARGVLDGIDLFDADFFGYSPREAELLDPQHRLFLECAWEALERAGYDPGRVPGPVGVFGGMTLSSYLLHHILPNRELVAAVGGYQSGLATDKDFLTTRVSYKLGLEGPSLDVQTACSTSLVATVVACQSLLAGQCDLALAGGVSVRTPQKDGYLYKEGGLDSSDGHCRAFDARADGSVYGSGVGVVVLKRLEDALAEGDQVEAVILGTAFNNDGAHKVGFTAPSIEGQARVVAAALKSAGVPAESVGYVEAHGTGTALGDPIEIAALTRAFAEASGNGRPAPGSCAIGSVKTNVGHLSAAAGVTGLIKAVLTLKHRAIPPSLNFSSPNPQIDFAATPFYVATRETPWPRGETPRRAGVSSFGLGGTNAHLVLEEAPQREPSGPSRPWQPIVLSARTEAALEAATDRLAAALEGVEEGAGAADAAYTLALGRRAFSHRRIVVASGAGDAREALASRDPRRLFTRLARETRRPVVFLFPGLGDHYPQMGRDLYEEEPVYRRVFDRAAEVLAPEIGRDLRRVVYPGERPATAAGGPDLAGMLGRRGGHGDGVLHRTSVSQPALFAAEYALARLWISWGIRPEAVAGYSLGEYVAACLAGVLRFEDALLLVARRARLIEELPAGAMLSVGLERRELEPLLGGDLDVAAVNGPELTVVAGPPEAVARLEERLGENGVACRRLPTLHAFHSRAMEPIAARLTELASGFRPSAPRIPVLSNVTGTWLTPREARDPGYWSRHTLGTVELAKGLETLWSNPNRALLEVGPGLGLATLALQNAPPEAPSANLLALPSMPGRFEARDAQAYALEALAKLWLAGVEVDWAAFYDGERRRRVSLPTYPFERRRFWIEPPSGRPRAAATPDAESQPAASAHQRPGLATPYAEPSDGRERSILAIFEELLGVRGLGVHDSFFELGGHSLMATQVLSRLVETFGVALDLAAFFADPTAAGLARAVSSAAGAPMPGLAAGHRPRGPDEAWEAPLSFAQERMWFLHQLQPASPMYNIPLPARLTGRLDVAALRASLTAVVTRHGVLRTAFPAAGGSPRQAIAPAVPWPLPMADLSRLETPRAAAETARLAADDARRPFDLASGPVMRTTLVRRSADDHALVVTMHHIASDGWSMGVFMEEVARYYASPAPRPEALPLQYADFAAWQRSWLEGDELARQVDYWREVLAGAPAALDLPTDRPRPPIRTPRGGRRHRRLGARLIAATHGFAGRENATPFMGFLAAWSALLGRLTGAADVVVGTLVANRRHVELERLIGFFVNTLALRVGLGGGPSFRDLVARARRAALGAFDHQDLPFERLVKELAVARDLSRTPVFQTMLVLQNTPLQAVDTGDLSLAVLPFEIDTSRFDLTLGLDEIDGRLLGYLEYDADLFDPVTVDRTLATFERLLTAAVEEPARPVAELPLLDAAQRHQVLAEWNDAAAEPPAAPTVHSLFEAWARRTPEAEAVAFGDVRMTYGELDAGAGHLAARLLALGVAPEEAVAVALERSEAVPVALLGVLKAGAAYLPLDLAYPEKRLAFMIADAGARVVVTRSASRTALPESGATVVDLDELGELPELSGAPLAVPVSPRQLAYLIYTSGSTGRPKGVEVPHAGVVSFLAAMARRPGLGAGDTVAALTTVAFDISVLELFLPLAVGGRTWIVGRDDAADPRRLAERLATARPAAIQATPATWRMLAADGWTNPEGAALLSGGEALKVDLARRLAASAPVWNLYGPTETTVWSALERFSDDAGGAGIAPIGRPIANTRILVVDRAARPVPCGVPGELVIGGRGVTRGYRRRPSLTAAAFVPDPFSAEPGGRLYRTGDLGRFGPLGRLEFLGRIDHQVKVRGFRIELGDVESALGRHPQVAQAVVTARPGPDGASRLVAYVVPRNGNEPALAELRRHLAGVLPDYMLPNALVTLGELPLTPNGKVDRRLLPEPGEPRTEKPFVAPRGPLEERIAEIWRDVLGCDRVGVEHDFFEIGGHSLLATQILSRLQDDFQVRISLQDLFAGPTVAHLAELIEKQHFSEAMDATERGLLDQVEGLSDDELERELARLGAVDS